jgi:hypothetical protein
MSAETISFDNKNEAQLVYVREGENLHAKFRMLDLDGHRPVIVLVGGAAGVEQRHTKIIRQVIEVIAQIAGKYGAAVVDGGTEAGCMAAMGSVYAQTGSKFPLIGVAARGTVFLPGQVKDENQWSLDPNHTHFILVPGSEWGDESPWISDVASKLAGAKPSVTVLVNGGEITRRDLAISREAGRPVFVVRGTGRLADELASDPPGDVLVTIVSGCDSTKLALELSLAFGSAV